MSFTLLGVIFGLGIPLIVLLLSIYINPRFKPVYILLSVIIFNAGLNYMIYLDRLPSYLLAIELIFIGGYMAYLGSKLIGGD